MDMIFKDVHGNKINIGDIVKPIDGEHHSKIVSIVNMPDYGGDVMFGQDMTTLISFDIISQENMSTQFEKI